MRMWLRVFLGTNEPARPRNMFPQFLKAQNPILLITPHHKLTFKDARASELAVFITNAQAFPQCTMNAFPIQGGVLAAFGEDLNAFCTLAEIHMHLAVLPIILPFHAHHSRSRYVAAMLDTAGLMKLQAAYLDSDLDLHLLLGIRADCRLRLGVWLRGDAFQKRDCGLEGILQFERIRKQEVEAALRHQDR